MRAIVIEEGRFQELFEKLTMHLSKRFKDGTVKEYGEIHYELHKFMDALTDDKPYCPDYMLKKNKFYAPEEDSKA